MTEVTDFLGLPIEKQLDRIAKMFLRKCGDPSKPWKTSYFAVRCYLLKQGHDTVKILYAYLTQDKALPQQSVWQAVLEAQRYDEWLRLSRVVVPQYKKYELSDLDN